MIFPPRVVSIVQIPLNSFEGERLNVYTIFKIRRGYQKLIRKSDLSSILSAQKFVRLFRSDENLSSCLNNYRNISF